MTPDIETGGNWLSIAQACQLFGVSDRTVKRRIEAGEIQSKLENLPRGGVRRLVLVDEREGHVRDKTARDVRDTEGTSARDTSKRETQTERDKTDERAGRAGQTERDARGTNGEVELLRATVERDREEIQFLRNVVEAQQRDAAELRQSLKKALEIAPRQLMQGNAPDAARNAQNGEQTAPMDTEKPARANEPQITPNRGGAVTYASIADELENTLGVNQ
jgi:hypothetical protein